MSPLNKAVPLYSLRDSELKLGARVTPSVVVGCCSAVLAKRQRIETGSIKRSNPQLCSVPLYSLRDSELKLDQADDDHRDERRERSAVLAKRQRIETTHGFLRPQHLELTVPLYSLRDSELKLSEHTASVLRIGVVPLYSLRDSELKR